MRARADIRWWIGPKAHQKVFERVEQINKLQRHRRQMDAHHAALYDDMDVLSSGPGAYDRLGDFEPDTLAFNIVRKNVNTLAARIAKSRPLPMAVTKNGSFQEQRRAKNFNGFVEGCFDENKVFPTSRAVARDGCLFGTAYSYTYVDGTEIAHERVLIDEWRIHPREARGGNPRSGYLARWVDRLVLAERFPKHANEIENSSAPPSEIVKNSIEDSADLVFVVEAWHLPSGPNANDGWHVICVSNATLLKERWERKTFPISVFRASEPLASYHGVGIARELTGLQFLVNTLAETIQDKAQNSGGYVFVEKGSTVEAGHIDNGPRNILYYTGTAPTFAEPDPMNPMFMDMLRQFMVMDSEVTLVSQMSLKSQIPAALTNASGKAISTIDDIESDRFVLMSRGWEDYHLDVAWQHFECAEQIAKKKGTYKVRAVVKERGIRCLREFDFKQVRIDRENFKLFVYPTSFLAKQPGMKMAQVQTLAGAGWINAREAKMLLDFPDLEAYQSLDQSAHDLVDAIIERFLTAEDPSAEGVYVYPEPFFDLALCITKAQQAYLRAKIEPDTDDEELWEGRLELIRTFITDAAAELKKQAQETAKVVNTAQGQAPPAAAA